MRKNLFWGEGPESEEEMQDESLGATDREF